MHINISSLQSLVQEARAFVLGKICKSITETLKMRAKRSKELVQLSSQEEEIIQEKPDEQITKKQKCKMVATKIKIPTKKITNKKTIKNISTIEKPAGEKNNTNKNILTIQEPSKEKFKTNKNILLIEEPIKETNKTNKNILFIEEPIKEKSTIKAVSPDEEIRKAIEHLKNCDPKLKGLIETHDTPQFSACSSAFQALLRSIVYQQLATKAAATIYSRLVVLCGGEVALLPETLAKLTAAEMRKVGISERKASYIHDLASKFTCGVLSDTLIFGMDDESLVSSLTAVRGIGVWSVHMFMIFSLHRPDVLPVGDLGVRKGFQRLYGLKSLPTPSQMESLSQSWKPYRSIGSWYMWRLIGMKAPIVPSE